VLKSFHRGVDRSAVIRAKRFRTPVKTRILAGGVHAARQQVVRIDRDSGWPVALELSAAILRKVSQLVNDCDAVILSDYGSDLITPALADAVRAALAKRSRRRPVPVLVDSRYRLIDYLGLTACTPNESEVERVLGVQIDDDPDALERAGRQLLQKTRMNGVLITRGSRGMSLFEPKRPTAHIPIFGRGEVADVTGAGDTVIATLGLALAAGASLYEAARLSNYAGGLVVKKRGTATVSAQELIDAVVADHDTTVENWSQEGPPQGRRST
jgi:D-glycero-beta-D-manno-heptose-7-phosphate kinase